MPIFISELTIFAPISNWERCGFEVVDGVLELSNANVLFIDSKLEDSRITRSRVVERVSAVQVASTVRLDHLMVHTPRGYVSTGPLLELGSDVRIESSESDVEEPSIWGVAFWVSDVSMFTEILDESKLGKAKPADQSNQMVSTFRSGAQLGIPCALMSPALA